MAGGALLAIGLLSFFDLHFFKTKWQGKAALAAGLLFLLATETMFLTSSGGGRYFYGQNADVVDCEYEIEQAFPFERGKKGGVIDENIKQCMDRLGYDWTVGHRHCQEAELATNSFCYLPKKTFARAIVAFQMQFE